MDWLLSTLLVMASLGLGLSQVPQHATVSPIDEYVYIDYLAKVPTQFVVHRGEETGEYARLYLSCNGVRILGFYPESLCTAFQPSDAAQMPNAGKTTADIYTPLYFVATWLLAQPLQLIGVDDLTAAGRLTGWTWLAAAAVLLYLALRRMRVHPAVAGGVGLLMVGSLPAYWSNTYISTDATSLLAGALMLFALTMIHSGARHAQWLFVLFSILITLAKFQNVMAVMAAAVVLIILAVGESMRAAPRGRLRTFFRDGRVITAAAALVLSIAAQALWVLIRSAIAVAPSPDQGVSAPLGRRALVDEVLKFFPGAGSGALDVAAVGYPAPIAATVMTWVIVAGVLGLLATAGRGSWHEALALASFVVALAAGPLLAVATTAITGYYFTFPARYGMSLLPFFLACAALLFTRSVWTRWLTPAIGATSYVAVLALTG